MRCWPGQTITDIARFGDKKLELLRRLQPFAECTPAHDHLGDILATLDAEHFQRGLVTWVASLIGVAEGVVAIEGAVVTIDAMSSQRAIAQKTLGKHTLRLRRKVAASDNAFLVSLIAK